MYEIGHMTDCKFTNKVETELEPPESIGHGFQEKAGHDVTQTINDESVWIMRKYVAFVNRNWEFCVEMMEEEINSLDISVEKDGKENTRCMSKVLKENRDYVVQEPIQLQK